MASGMNSFADTAARTGAEVERMMGLLPLVASSAGRKPTPGMNSLTDLSAAAAGPCGRAEEG